MADDVNSILGIEQPHPAATGNNEAAPRPYFAEKLSNRYRDGYRVGKALVAIGGAIKIIGFILGGIAVIVAIIAFASIASDADAARGLAIFLLVILYGALITFFFYVYGLLVSGVGQIVFGVLDGAMFNAPFLTDDQKAQALGLD